MAFVVMGHCTTSAGNKGQTRLGSVECLDLGFLVSADDECFLRWVEIEANDVD